MKVLHVIPYMHPSAGGPPVVVERLAEQAPSGGWNASVITTFRFCQDDGSELEKSLRQRMDITVLRRKWGSLFQLQRETVEAVRQAVRRANLVHLHTLWHPLNTIARKACEHFGRKYVLSPHGMLDPYSLGVKPVRKRLYMALREGCNLKNADRLVFTTPLEEQLACTSLKWLGKGEVIPLGADQPPPVARSELTAQFEARFPETTDRRRLIFLGRIHEKKGLERIFEALPEIAARIPKILLTVVGSGEPRYVARLKTMARRKGLEPHVFFAGALHGEAKWSALAAAEAFLLPSHQENFAIAVAEAMHMGLPVVLSDKVNLWPFVSDALAGVIVPDDHIPTKLGDAIINLLDKPDELAAMGARAKECAQKQFIWSNTYKLTIDMYDRALSQDDMSGSGVNCNTDGEALHVDGH